MSALKSVSFKKPVAAEPRLSVPYVPGKRSSRFWSDADDALLRKHYPVGGVAASLAHLPHKTMSGVYQRARKLELTAGRGDRISPPEGFDHALREFYQSGDGKKRGECNDFADRHGLPRWWVTKRATRLGLVIPHKKEPPWSERERALMPTLPLHDVEKCAEIMREHGFVRSPTAIMVMAKKMDLSRRYRDTMSATAVSRILGVDAKSVTREILAGDLVAEKRETNRLAQQGGDPWSVTAANLRRYILTHLQRIDLRKVDKFAFVQIVAAEPLDKPKDNA